MTIRNENTADVLPTNVDRTSGPREVGNAKSSKTAAKDINSSGDSVAFSLAASLVQQASTPSPVGWWTRTMQLKTAIDSNQYNVDPQAVSQAIVKSGLMGM